MTLLSPFSTALVLAVALRRSGRTRARLSAATIRAASGGTRKALRAGFQRDLGIALEDHGWALIELDVGGFAAIQIASLAAARTVTLKRTFSDPEREALSVGTLDLARLTAELRAPPDDDEEPDVPEPGATAQRSVTEDDDAG
jgi:hypothetical protein